MLSCALNVEDEWVVRGRDVEESMVSIAGTASVEAVEANIEAGRVVDGVEALCAIFPVDRLCWARRPEL
jgi:hypothetical protein